MSQMSSRQAMNQALETIQQLLPILAGRLPDATGTLNEIMREVAIEAQTIIYEAYLIKAAGGTDAAGISWPPPKPATVAARKRRDTKDAWHEEDRKKSKRFQEAFLSKYREHRKAGLSNADASGNASAHANLVVQSIGGYGVILDSPIAETLIDTGDLVDCFRPGSTNPNAIFDIRPGYFNIGSSLVYAHTHQYGDPSRNIPRRQIWPDEDLPAEWYDRLTAKLQAGIERLLSKLMA